MAITGADIVNAAAKYKGVKYFEGNPQNTTNGFDCSGIVQRAMADLGVSIPRTTSQQLAAAGAANIGTNINKAQQGDIIHYVGHEEIFVGYQGGGLTVFSEATPGTVAAFRKQTPWPVIGIVRYSNAGPGPATNGTGAGGQVNNAPTDVNTDPNSLIDSLPDFPFAPIKPLLKSIIGITQGTVSVVSSLANFLSDITNPDWWKRVAQGFLGSILLLVGALVLMKHKKVITITGAMVKKGADVASSA